MKFAAYMVGPHFSMRVNHTTVALNSSGIVVLPVGVWAILTFYVPILGSFLSAPQAWLIALIIVLFAGISLVGHVLAHIWAARAVGSEAPDRLSLLLLGDTAQAWPVAPTPWREFGAACAGSGFNLLLAGVAYLGWNAQLTPVLNLSLLFTVAFNLWLAVVNLTPAFPLDGGRVARAILWGLAAQPKAGGRLARGLGVAVPVGLSAWAVFLLAQRMRFSVPTAGTTFGVVLLLVAGQLAQPAWIWDRPLRPVRRVVGTLVAAVVILLVGMLAADASLVLTNDGIEAPGPALSIEPMVAVAPPYRHDHRGTFILTSVDVQTPILGAQWAWTKMDPTVRLVPPESIVPENTTPQSWGRQGFQELDESMATATVVGLREAGYDARFVGKGAAVVSVLPGSPALGRLQPGDVITALNGKPVSTTGDLIQGTQGLDPGATAQLQVVRGDQSLSVALPLLPPDATNRHPHIGIGVKSAGVRHPTSFPGEDHAAED